MIISSGYGSDYREHVVGEYTLDQEVEGNIALFEQAAHLSGNGHLLKECSLQVTKSGRIIASLYGTSGEDVLLLCDSMKEMSTIETRVQKEQLYINLYIG